jgi:hypothetical protein
LYRYSAGTKQEKLFFDTTVGVNMAYAAARGGALHVGIKLTHNP